MTLDKARHGQAAVDHLIRELELERIFGFKPGSVFGGSSNWQRAFVRAVRDFQPTCMAAIRSFANSTNALTSLE